MSAETKKFYWQRAWKECQAAYMKKAKGLCELCLKEGRITPAEIVHHKVHITPENLNNPEITFNHDNLMAVCRKHHAEIHKGKGSKRYTFGDDGRIIFLDE